MPVEQPKKLAPNETASAQAQCREGAYGECANDNELLFSGLIRDNVTRHGDAAGAVIAERLGHTVPAGLKLPGGRGVGGS